MMKNFFNHIHRQSLTHRQNFAGTADLRVLISRTQLLELQRYFKVAEGTTLWAPREEDYLQRDTLTGLFTHLMGMEIITTLEDMKPPMVVRLPST